MLTLYLSTRCVKALTDMQRLAPGLLSRYSISAYIRNHDHQRSCVALTVLAMIVIVMTPVLGIAAKVISAEEQTDYAQTENSIQPDEPISDEVRWKRAIDRDDTDMLRQLLSRVDVTLTNDKGKTALMAAAKTGQFDLLETLLQLGLDIEDRSFTGGTSLMYAALGQQHSMISYLIGTQRQSSGFQSYVDAESTNGWTAVMIAAAKGFEQVVEQLVVEGQADAWRADAYQWTPLMRAIDNRHTAVVHYLLDLDQPPLSATNENGATALHVAVEKGDVSTVSLLLAHNVDQEIRDNEGRTARDIAVNQGDQTIVQLLRR